ncbi:F-box/kelch-repeat protein At3g23880-like [Lotus japonicus]|uniref:F-box/kelch-repeat protein At3g23880-like n=1 Tax=Lotus japonicus TaxID=34305 RepID=UPI00258B3823|nr:F-box/kelch-repeat protein At3g23880-like [Lotus japonicus]
MKERKLSFIGDSPHAPPLPPIPFDLVVEILCRLPVKSLLQFRCVCKSWNSLISDPKFAKKHLHCSPANFTRHHLIASYLNDSRQLRLKAHPLLSVFDTVPATAAQLEYPLKKYKINIDQIVGSCNGIVCVANHQNFTLFWNPFTRRFKKSPPLENPNILGYTVYGFGYDYFADSYKVVAVFCFEGGEVWFYHRTQVKVHTLGTNCWRRIQGLPSCFPVESGKFVSGRLNWLATDNDWCAYTKSIISLDLGNECYQKILQPDDYGHDGEMGV